ncbi:hypothetical protein, partial [Amycolatopsis sp. w19]
MQKALQEAEKKARLREIENGKVLSEEELNYANELQAKANSKGMKLVPERKIKNKVRFVQLIQENILYLRDIKYLTTAEKNFLMDLVPNVEFSSNCIVNDSRQVNSLPVTQSDLAEILGKKKQNINPI